ncbi:YtxH domain-containing protein [Lacinutrix jangbogonensis]|uniref:YtxH domain-containing protein n=1 Tax=Lacinutrix jangbogonensis TaxID=1469557 RepID=UPI00053EA16A|nr:YtxH domain-containing protein [Lacinutrix jangbogonensis]
MINKGTVAIGLILGSALGAALGVLFAPDKGANTREYLKDESLNVVDVIKKDASVLKEDLTASVKVGKAKFKEEIGIVANKASHKADDVINVLEKGLKILKEKNKKLQKTS